MWPSESSETVDAPGLGVTQKVIGTNRFDRRVFSRGEEIKPGKAFERSSVSQKTFE